MSEIQYIKRRDLEVAKYDACVEKSDNARMYALSWYLDSVADHWDVLVYGDYEAVMPVPFLKLKRHLFFAKIYVPPLVQQLGIFSKETVNLEVEKLFMDEFRKLKPQEYTFTALNYNWDFLNPNLCIRPNFELNLQEGSQILFQNYTQNTQRNCKKAQKSNLKIQVTTDITRLIAFQTLESEYKLKKSIYTKLKLLYKELNKRNLAILYEVIFEGETVAMALMLFYQNHIINLVPVSNHKGKQLHAMTFLLDNLIQKYAGKPMILDFEGSSVENIARFYRGFGAKTSDYFLYQKPSLFTSLRWYFLNKK